MTLDKITNNTDVISTLSLIIAAQY